MTEQNVARSDPAGFEEFYEKTSARMLTRATMICGSTQDAEDAMAEAYLEAFRRWDRVGGYEPRAAEKWVHTTMQRRWWKTAARRRRRETGELRVPVRPCSSPEQTAEVTMVLGALSALSERERIVVLAHCVYGLSQKEVADRLGVRSALVAVYLFQARRKLERLLGLARPPKEPGERFTRLPGLFGADGHAHLDDPLVALLRTAWGWLREAFEAEAESGSGADSGTGTGSGTETGSGTGTGSETGSGIDTRSETGSETRSGSRGGMRSGARPEARSGARSEARAGGGGADGSGVGRVRRVIVSASRAYGGRERP
ncbi:sigma-70 family RNA polymerase sigma factor [Streptosporangium sp. NPDC051022]|uniref:RNA polymerase sigma factor n=1 Tax=Streptosporangium sp. NPDC051022 TaxID=3155752 RepID=UPI003440B86F